MKTVFCEFPTSDAACELRHPTWKIKFKWRRAVVLASNDAKLPPMSAVVKVQDGNKFDSVESKAWLSRSILDDLQEEYKLRSPVAGRKALAAIDKWWRARQALHDHERQRQRFVKKLNEAAAELVRSRGRGPLEVDGRIFHVSYVEDSRTNSKCQGEGGTFVYWIESGGHR